MQSLLFITKLQGDTKWFRLCPEHVRALSSEIQSLLVQKQPLLGQEASINRSDQQITPNCSVWFVLATRPKIGQTNRALKTAGGRPRMSLQSHGGPRQT